MIGLRVLGIDLGTSLCSAAVIEEGKAVPLRIGTAASLLIGDSYCMPSSVFIEEDGRFLLGQAADNSRMKNPVRYRKEFKRDLGASQPYHLGNMELMPEDLYKELLKYFRLTAEERLGGSIERVVITHPANYAGYKKELIKKSAIRSGFSQIELIDEPTAAAIYYSSKEKVEIGEKILVYDLGGGTFDVSLIEKREKGFIPLTAPLGIGRCGGVDFQRKIYEDIVNSFSDEIVPMLSSGTIGARQFAFMLEAECIKIKHHLSTASKAEAVINLPGSFEFKNYEITREKFEGMIKEDIELTCSKIEDIVKNSGVKMEEIDRILLVGGSSRIPYIEEMIGIVTGKAVSKDADTELVVALGAAIYGYTLDDQKRTSEHMMEESKARIKETLVNVEEDEVKKIEKPEKKEYKEALIQVPESYKHYFKPSNYTEDQIVALEVGSTFSRIACVSDGRVRIIINSEGEKELPTAICFHEGKCITGRLAKHIGSVGGTLVYTDVNNLIRINQKVNIDGRSYPAELLYAFLIQRLKEDAGKALEKNIKQIILVIPMYFSHRAKRKIRQAAKVAGVEILRIIDSCSANAISYAYLNPEEKSNLLLCNVGGESTETAIVNVKPGEIKVSHKLDTLLSGGNDYTRSIVNYAMNYFMRISGIDLAADRRARENIYSAAEVCKAELLTSFTTKMHLGNINNSSYGIRDLILELKKSDYAAMTSVLTNEIANRCLLDIGIQNSIDKIILIGEGAAAPIIKERINTVTGKMVVVVNNSQFLGVLGGAIVLGIISGEIRNLIIIDCISWSLGIKNGEGKREILIPKNTTIPASISKIITGANPRDITILEGEGLAVKEEDILECIRINEIISASGNEWKLQMTIGISEDGSIEIKIRDIKSGKEIWIQL